jgi:hypothetical protein
MVPKPSLPVTQEAGLRSMGFFPTVALENMG